MTKDLKHFARRLPIADVSATSYVIGPHPDGYVLRDNKGAELSPVLSSAELLARWCEHNGYKAKYKRTIIFVKNNGRARRKK